MSVNGNVSGCVVRVGESYMCVREESTIGAQEVKYGNH